MLVRVTGGISRDEGGLYPVETAECGVKPVRTIGGWSRVEIAVDRSVELAITASLSSFAYIRTILPRFRNGTMVLGSIKDASDAHD